MPLKRLMFEATQTGSVTRLCHWKAQKTLGWVSPGIKIKELV